MDKQEIEKRIKYIEDRLKKLKLYLKKYDITKAGSEDNYSAFRTIERECEEIIESGVRINQEILSDSGDIGETYRASFEKLSNCKISFPENILTIVNNKSFSDF